MTDDEIEVTISVLFIVGLLSFVIWLRIQRYGKYWWNPEDYIDDLNDEVDNLKKQLEAEKAKNKSDS